MQSEPRDLSRATLATALDRHWSIASARLDYRPLGFGSHHWEAIAGDGTSWFVTADDLRAAKFGDLDRAFRTATALHDDAGLEFVLAPIPGTDGSVLCRVGERYAVRVDPFVAGTARDDGEFHDPDERRAVATLVGRLHAASAAVPPDIPAREDFALAGRDELVEALTELDTRWGGGPFAEPTRELLRSCAADVEQRLVSFDHAAGRLLSDQSGWVITHGEPHSANVLRATAGGLWLVDWDTARIAPRERDLWMVLDADRTGWDEYRAVTGATGVNDVALDLYRERWALAEICEYVAAFRRPHEVSDDTRAAWEELGEYLPG